MAPIRKDNPIEGPELQHKEMRRLRSSSEYADMTITCRGEMFKCHKAIVAERVPFFKAAIKNGWKESVDATVDLSDDDPVAIKMMIDFLYTYDAPDIYETYDQFEGDLVRAARTLYGVVDKYDVPGLVKMVGEAIKVDFALSVTHIGPYNVDEEKSPELPAEGEISNKRGGLPLDGQYIMNWTPDQIITFIHLVFDEENPALHGFKQTVVSAITSNCTILRTRPDIHEAICKAPELSSDLLSALARRCDISGNCASAREQELKSMGEALKTARADLCSVQSELEKSTTKFKEHKVSSEKYKDLVQRYMRGHERKLEGTSFRGFSPATDSLSAFYNDLIARDRSRIMAGDYESGTLTSGNIGG